MQTAEKISITITPEALEAVRESVALGEYASTSEVIRDAVRLWQRERDERKARLEVIKARIHKSANDPRPRLTTEEVRARMEERYREALKKYPDEAV